jgi:hypothetical protein
MNTDLSETKKTSKETKNKAKKNKVDTVEIT